MSAVVKMRRHNVNWTAPAGTSIPQPDIAPTKYVYTGDIFIARVFLVNGATITSAPTGWNLITSIAQGDLRVSLYWALPGASAGNFTASTSGLHMISISVMSGADTTNPIASFNSSTSSSGSSIYAPALTAIGGGLLTLVAGEITGSISDNPWTPTSPQKQMDWSSYDNQTVGSVAYSVGYEQVNDGVTGTRQWTAEASFNNLIAITLNFRPATSNQPPGVRGSGTGTIGVSSTSRTYTFGDPSANGTNSAGNGNEISDGDLVLLYISIQSGESITSYGTNTTYISYTTEPSGRIGYWFTYIYTDAAPSVTFGFSDAINSSYAYVAVSEADLDQPIDGSVGPNNITGSPFSLASYTPTYSGTLGVAFIEWTQSQYTPASSSSWTKDSSVASQASVSTWEKRNLPASATGSQTWTLSGTPSGVYIGFYIRPKQIKVYQGGVNLIAGGSLSSGSAVIRSATTSLVAAGSLSSSSVKTTSGATNLNAAGKISISTAGRTTFGAVVLAARGVLSVRPNQVANVVLSAPGKVTSTPSITALVAEALSARGTLFTAPIRATEGATGLSAPGKLSSTGIRISTAVVNLIGKGYITTNNLRGDYGTVSLNAAGKLEVSGTPTRIVTVNLFARGVLQSAVFATRSVGVNLFAPGVMTTLSTAQIKVASVALNAAGNLNSFALSSRTASANLVGRGVLSSNPIKLLIKVRSKLNPDRLVSAIVKVRRKGTDPWMIPFVKVRNAGEDPFTILQYPG